MTHGFTKKITLPFLLILFFNLSAFALPLYVSEEEASKAPALPTNIHVADKECSGTLSKEEFKHYLTKIEGLNSFMHRSFMQIDLNADGSCEFIAFQAGGCGNGGCAQRSIKLYDGKVMFLGGAPKFWSFHSPSNGWIQLSAISQAGAAVSVQRLYEFQEGRYRRTRQDKYKQGGDDIFRYVKTTH